MPSRLNWREEKAREYAESQGWQVLDRGWPDFLLYKKETGECICLEIKSPTDELSPAQKKLHWVLRQLNIDVRTVVVGNHGHERELQAAVCTKPGKWRRGKPKPVSYRTIPKVIKVGSANRRKRNKKAR